MSEESVSDGLYMVSAHLRCVVHGKQGVTAHTCSGRHSYQAMNSHPSLSSCSYITRFVSVTFVNILFRLERRSMLVISGWGRGLRHRS